MNFKSLEISFLRAFGLSFSKKKVLICFPIIFAFGIISVFLRFVACSSSYWIMFSLNFFSILLFLVAFFMLCIFLCRIYYSEVKKIKVTYLDAFKHLFEVIPQVVQISFIPLALFFGLWVLLGFFVIFQNIPHIGEIVAILVSIVPFIIVFLTIAICILFLFAVFFIAPGIAMKKNKNIKLLNLFSETFTRNLFSKIFCFMIGLFVVFLISLVLILALKLTQRCFIVPSHQSFQNLFSMLPLSFIFTPFFIFFCNFSLEVYNLLIKKD